MASIDITYSQRGYCSKAGYRRLEQVLSDCKDLYNAALQERRDAYRQHGTTVSWVDQNRSLTDIRADWPEREGAVDRRVQRGVLRRLDRAYQAFFRRVKAGESPGFPRFQSWQRYRTIEIEAPTAAMLKVRADGLKAWVKVKGLPIVIVRPSRPLPSAACLKSLRLVSRRVGVHSVKDGGRDKLSWQVDLGFRVEREPLLPESRAVGIDMGVTNRLALSTGELIEGRQSGHKKPRRARRHGPRSSEQETRVVPGASPCIIRSICAEGVAPHSAETPTPGRRSPSGRWVAPHSAETPSFTVTVRAENGVAPHSAETPQGQPARIGLSQVAPHSAETPQDGLEGRPSHRVAPHSAETPLERFRSLAKAAVAPHSAETPSSAVTLTVKSLVAPHSAETPAGHVFRFLKYLVAPHSAETPANPSALRIISLVAPHSAETLVTRKTEIQQTIARCKKGSRRQRKLYRQLARLQHRVAIVNRNECHRTTTAVIRQFGRIAVEKLNIPGMTRSAAGTVDEPGRQVAAKSGLNREILTQTWGKLREQLRYKATWADREFVEVDPSYTSRICSRCELEGERNGKDFTCSNCNLSWDADLNAAVNILLRAFGPEVRRNTADNPQWQPLLMPAETKPIPHMS